MPTATTTSSGTARTTSRGSSAGTVSGDLAPVGAVAVSYRLARLEILVVRKELEEKLQGANGGVDPKRILHHAA